MKQKKGCGGLTEEDCVPQTHTRDVGEGRQRAEKTVVERRMRERRCVKDSKRRLKEGI